jgi:Ca-activated chloride channel family protein
MIGAAVLLILAMARPRFGPTIGPPLPPGHDVVLQIDVSRSMGAEDAVPSRLAVAVESASSLVDALSLGSANRVAVVAFAGRGVVRYPLTVNLGAVKDVLRRLQPGTVQPGGTDIGGGLNSSLDALGQEEHSDGRTIVIFSDGEDNAEHWRNALDRVSLAGIIVHGVAIGDAEQGHPVPLGKPGHTLTFNGEQVLSRRSDTALEAIARQTNGAVVKLGLARADLGSLYRSRIAPVARRKREARVSERPDQFPLFLTAALGFVVAGCWPAERLGPWRWLWNRSTGAVVLVALAVTAVGAGREVGKRDSAVDLVARGDVAYSEGRFAEALALFEAAIPLAPDQPIPRYNAAATLFQLQRHDEARQHYQEAWKRADDALRVKIDYALGNAALALGDIPGAIEHYDHCLSSAAGGTSLTEVRQDAAINRDFALEQTPPSLGSEDENERDQPPPRQRSRASDSSKRGAPDSDPSRDDAGGGDPNGPPAGGQGQDDQPGSGRRRMGGAGGANQLPSGSSGESPDDRLDSALEEIRDASRRRLPEETPADASTDPRKDW